MSRKETYEERAEALILPVLGENALELVDTEYVKEAGTWYLRYYIDKPGGVTIGDCETVSRAVSDLLDREDFIEEAYVLEVSSPGLGRQIKKEKDYTRNLGKIVEIRLFKPVGSEKELTGTLTAFDRDTVKVTAGGTETVVERKNIALIREYADFSGIGTKEDEDQNEQGTV